MAKLGFIGIGNMGEAILRGILKKGLLPAHNIYIFDLNKEKIQALQQELGVLTAQSNSSMLAACDYALLAVKPNVCAEVLNECSIALKGKALISIVTGWTRPKIESIVPDCRILRVMPNTPCMVGEGMVALDLDHSLTDEEFRFALELFNSTGTALPVPSYLMDAVVGVSGSGPAYVYLFIEALADGGVRAGLPRKMAYALAAQTVLGAAKMVQETGAHPGALKDAVCSPAGTTIEAVAALEHGGLRAAVLDAVEVCVRRAQELADHGQ
ncbi:MAG: Pyrroline-5-carboxylate reductase [Firmicutes bacterium ADurb.Bin356]|nr:MAG: Pyrroline-5-carboxylate reductase [Firmicutes bacterium ADurb.Bin356]